MSNFLVNNNKMLNTFFIISKPQQGPDTNYKIIGTDIGSQFTLYMHGTRTKCNYQVGGVDLGNYYQIDVTNFVYNMGSYNFTGSPWGILDQKLNNASWIWSTPNAYISAPGSDSGFFYWFYYTFYYSGANNTGTIYVVCDNVCTVYFNNIIVPAITGGGWASATAPSSSVNIKNGLNYIRIPCYNTGGGSTNNIYCSGITNVTQVGANNVYIFDNDSTISYITFTQSTIVNILIVGGGGGGGPTGGGGGGGGGVYSIENYTILPGKYTITVGQGGNGSYYNTTTGVYSIQTTGGTSSIVNSANNINLSVLGGGYGSTDYRAYTGANIPGTGANGGGQGRRVNQTIINASGDARGNIGGSGSIYSGGGGGGYGSQGQNSPDDNTGGNGGNGITNSILSTGTYYGGGGGGGDGNANNTYVPSGGLGGGGKGGIRDGTSINTEGDGKPGNYYGGGGGGGGYSRRYISSTLYGLGQGGSGYKGVVMISVSNIYTYTSDATNSAGLICSVYDSTQTNVANSNSNWTYSIVTNPSYKSTTSYNNIAAALTYNNNAI